MKPVTKNEFNELKSIMFEKFGIELKEGKTALVETRLSKVIEQRGLSNLSEYISLVLSDKTGEIEQELAVKLTTNHTFFMREEDHFEYLAKTVLPFWMSKLRDKDLRIWSAGCSSGEEPYTLAMIISDVLGFDKNNWDSKILATDLSTAVLEKAIKGIYEEEALERMPKAWKKRFFNSISNSRYEIKDELKEEVIFRHFNLKEDSYPFRRKFHCIFCRNVMIYFNDDMKNHIISRFYHNTEYGGYLFIGHSETLGKNTHGFTYIRPSVYRKEF